LTRVGGMPTFRTGFVQSILSTRPGLQRLTVLLDGEKAPSKAVNYTDLLGAVAVNDEIVCNTSAVELGLGTGGWHIVHWNLSNREIASVPAGHIMKMRYSSCQTPVLAASSQESSHHDLLATVDTVDGMPVAVCGLHSQIAAVAGAFAASAPGARLAYVMTDAASLPLTLSDLVSQLRAYDLLCTTVSTGQAFGGEYESVTVASGLLVARYVCEADAVVVGMGPGVVGTGTKMGFSALEVAALMETVAGVKGMPVGVVRASEADQRVRHRGVSHHTMTAFTFGSPGRRIGEIAVPSGAMGELLSEKLLSEGVADRYEIVSSVTGEWRVPLEQAGVVPRSMGRGVDEDPLFWEAAASAGARLGALVSDAAISLPPVVFLEQESSKEAHQ